jgi:hypothetical protein
MRQSAFDEQLGCLAITDYATYDLGPSLHLPYWFLFVLHQVERHHKAYALCLAMDFPLSHSYRLYIDFRT